MRKSNIFDPNCPSCAKGIEVYYATQNQEYTYESGIYGFYTLQPSEKIVNGRAYFKKGKFGIWWDGQDKWTIGFDSNKGSNIGCACIEKDVFCLHSVKEWDWELFWGDTGDWEKARKSLGVRISSTPGEYKPLANFLISTEIIKISIVFINFFKQISIVKLAKRELKFIMPQKPKNIQGIFMEIIQFNQILSMEEHISRKVILAFGGMEMIVG